MRSKSGTSGCRLVATLALGAAVAGCGGQNVDGQSTEAANVETSNSAIFGSDDSTIGPILVKQYNDCRGRVQSAIWLCFTSQPKEVHQASCVIPDAGYVAVGGGAEVSNPNGTYPGAYLIDGQIPANLSFDRYRASSKSHGNSHPHGLRVYVAGLRIQGVTPQQLRDNLQRHEVTLGPAANPETLPWQKIPAGRVMLSISTFLEWQPSDGIGQLLVGNWGSTATGDWGVKTKSLGQNFSAKLRGSALTLPNSIGGINLAARDSQTNVTVSSGVAEATLTVPRMALTNIGGWAYYAGAGRMIQALAPTLDTAPTVFARTKDHVTPDGGGTYVQAMGIQETFGNQCVPPL